MTLLLIGMGLSAATVAGSAVCGWIGCWLWTTRTRRPARHRAAAGGLRRPTPAEDAALLAAADDRMRATHRHDRTSVPVYRVSSGNIREDALDPEHRFASMPLFVRNPDGCSPWACRSGEAVAS